MKVNKNILMSLIMIGVLSLGTSAATYTAFSSKVKSLDNKIETVTYTINNKVGDQEFHLFTLDNAIPGSTAILTGLEAKATGNREMNITPNLILTVGKRNINNGMLSETTVPVDLTSNPGEAIYFEIKTKVDFKDKVIFDSNDQFVPMKSFMDAINNAGEKALSKGETFKISDGQIRINSNAMNDYQGAVVEAKLTLTAGDLVASN